MKSIWKLRRLWLLLTIPVSLALLFLASHSERFAEWYATAVYPVLSHIGNRLTGLLPFSIGEFFVYALVILLLAVIIRFAVRMVRGKGQRCLIAGKFFVNLLCLAGCLLFLFTVNCGINYNRSTFAQTCGLTIQESQKSELIRLCESLASDASLLRGQTESDDNSVMALRARGFSQNAEKARTAFDSLDAEYPLLRAGYGRPKPVLASRLMSRCNITGMFFPFTFEANVNTDVPEYTIPFTMCHELSHLRGFMREDEANFIAYLACRNSTDPDFRYSGAAMAFTYASNALFSVDSSAAGKIYSDLSVGVRRDLQFNNEYWDRFKGPVSDAATSVNNSYLKANRQKDGVQSYGRMVDLLLALQRSEESKKRG
jgi:hypothetical protein